MWKHFQPGEGPSRGLLRLRDCENQLWNRWIVCSTTRGADCGDGARGGRVPRLQAGHQAVPRRQGLCPCLLSGRWVLTVEDFIFSIIKIKILHPNNFQSMMCLWEKIYMKASMRLTWECRSSLKVLEIMPKKMNTCNYMIIEETKEIGKQNCEIK